MKFFDKRLVLSLTFVIFGLALILVGFSMEANLTGDGAYYFGMLEGLARHGSPALTEEVRSVVRARLNIDPTSLARRLG
jgi:hypothetical protein